MAMAMQQALMNMQAPLQSCTVRKSFLNSVIKWPAMTGPVRAKTAAHEYIIPVHWPSFACAAGSGPRMWATDAGGRPMTAPEKMPKTTTKAMADLTVSARVHRIRTRRDAIVVTKQWTFIAPKWSHRYAELRRPMVEVAFMILRSQNARIASGCVFSSLRGPPPWGLSLKPMPVSAAHSSRLKKTA